MSQVLDFHKYTNCLRNIFQGPSLTWSRLKGEYIDYSIIKQQNLRKNAVVSNTFK